RHRRLPDAHDALNDVLPGTNGDNLVVGTIDSDVVDRIERGAENITDWLLAAMLWPHEDGSLEDQPGFIAAEARARLLTARILLAFINNRKELAAQVS